MPERCVALAPVVRRTRSLGPCSVPNASVANVSVARLFSVETLYTGNYTPLGVHKPWM